MQYSSIAQEYLTDILYLNDIMDFIQAKISSRINNQLYIIIIIMRLRVYKPLLYSVLLSNIGVKFSLESLCILIGLAHSF